MQGSTQWKTLEILSTISCHCASQLQKFHTNLSATVWAIFDKHKWRTPSSDRRSWQHIQNNKKTMCKRLQTDLVNPRYTYILVLRLTKHKRWSMPTAICRRRHLYCSAYKYMPWQQQLFSCWPTDVEQFTSGVAPIFDQLTIRNKPTISQYLIGATLVTMIHYQHIAKLCWVWITAKQQQLHRDWLAGVGLTDLVWMRNWARSAVCRRKTWFFLT